MEEKRRRTLADYEAAADDYERNPVRADEAGPIEIGPGLTDADYAELADDYARNPITADEVIGVVSVNPAHLRDAAQPDDDDPSD